MMSSEDSGPREPRSAPAPGSSPASAPRARKRPEERRAEILDVASQLALAEGLERITLRAVAERLGVRPGLISHYFPAAEDLVAAAFSLAITGEREELIPSHGSPLERVAHLVQRTESGAADELSRLWLNARHLSRFAPALDAVLEAEEELDRNRLLGLIEEGVSSGAFTPNGDAYSACIRIFVSVDGYGAYVNNTGPFSHPAYDRFVSDCVVRELGIPEEELRAAVERVPAV